jgi:hypothetical protein
MGSDFYKEDPYRRLNITVHFIRDLMELAEKHKVPYRGPWKIRDMRASFLGPYNQIARLMFEVIHSAASVSEPAWTSWEVQHNSVWSDFFTHGDSKGWRIVRFKMRRMIYDEVKRMEEFPNYKGARLLGLSLSVLGFREKRTRDIFKDTTVFKAPIAAWTQRNFLKLLDYNPDIAKACLHGSVTFDDKSNRLVKTFNSLGKEPNRDYLQLASPCINA